MIGWATWTACAGVVIAMSGPLLVRLGLPSVGGMGLALVGALTGVVAAVGLFSKGGPGSLAIVALVPFVGFALFAWGHRKYPVMNDISTDLDDPPAFVAAAALAANNGRDLAPQARDAAMQREHYPEVRPFRTRAVPDPVWTIVKAVAADTGWEVHHVDEDARTLEAVAVTGQFLFHDDVSVRVRDLSPGTIVDMRAKARVGRSDFGANAQRIQDFKAAVRARLPSDLAIDP